MVVLPGGGVVADIGQWELVRLHRGVHMHVLASVRLCCKDLANSASKGDSGELLPLQTQAAEGADLPMGVVGAPTSLAMGW